jgi:hypothetical protein
LAVDKRFFNEPDFNLMHGDNQFEHICVSKWVNNIFINDEFKEVDIKELLHDFKNLDLNWMTPN